MSTNSTNHDSRARRIHHALGGTTAFFQGYTIGELMLFIGTALITLVGAALVPATLTLPVIGGGVMIGLSLGLLHKVKPGYLWLTEWLGARLTWALKDDAYTHGDADSNVRYLTRVNRVLPHAVERTDGALVGGMQIEPANMALEDQQAWSNAIQSLSEFANSTVEFPVQVYITSRDVADGDVVREHQARLSDGDVQSRPVLERLLEESIADNTDADGAVDPDTATIREYYLLTAVTEDDIQEGAPTGDSVLGYLADVPVIGGVFERFQGEELSADERVRLQEEKLEARLGQLRRGGTSLYRCSMTPVDGYDLARVTTEYWTGHTQSYADLADALGTFPVVSHGLTERVSTTPNPDDVLAAAADDTASDEDLAAASGETPTGGLASPAERQQSVIAPSSVDWQPTYAVLNDETYVRTFWVEQFPEEPADGMFERLLLATDLNADISMHVDPFDSQSAADMMADWISDLKVTQHDASSLKAEDLQADIDRGKHMRSLVRANKASFYRGGVFIRLSADSKQALDSQSARLRSIVRDAPANSTLKVANRWQERGLATVAPLGRNELGHDRMSTMTNQAFGAMFPFSSNYLRMDDGIEYGTHGHNGSPVRINPWELETGHSELVVGMPGAGKTYGGIMRQLRTMKRRQDTMLVLIDPVGGFRGIADAMDAKTISVGGDTQLNPLEIRETPQAVLDADGSVSPLAAKKDEVHAILENFLDARDIQLGTETGVLSYVIDEAYRQAGVHPGDISTHTPANSPTMTDVHDILSDIAANPSEHNIADSESAQQRAAEYADELAIALQPFREGGAYDNLAARSDVDILEGDNKVVYIDLGQIEGTASGIDRQTFLMQLLLSTVYQQAKRTDQHVELAIDEAHYLFEDQANLDFLETAFRHQRHAGLRMVLLSQTAQEFYESEQAEKILGMCPIKVFHKLPDLDDDIADKIGLTREQRQYIRRADAGNDALGYSQALVRVEEHGTYPLHVAADAFEDHVIAYESDDREIIQDALNKQSPRDAAFQDTLQAEAQTNALVNRLDVDPERVERILEDGFTDDELIETVLAGLGDTPANGTTGERGVLSTDGGQDAE
ncbi:VirB4 family type IV secretion system protein [Halobacterium sp. KA-6]|uniref:VirB4 family type IV secretion system protein n=1 Tax=Halobacterium sp. KA-6 TaxID=2896368 RepID=UPI001E350B8C|nr:conjugal transfer protein [Halobacterium sp. KA-6]MCD2205077.1 conjugal transfer protein [Halobacterium sp. KA-6]